ncbi:MAG: hypothetical protein N3B13_06550, partial [Deltaproteobacteria bacterium]|nr:hypothetical protein [Deltaproteobacteria bacterium]
VGLSLNAQNICDFADAFEAVVKGSAEFIRELPEIVIDDILEPQNIGRDFFTHIEQLAPFGNENPEPVFYSAGYKVLSFRYQKGTGILQLRKNGRQETGLIWGEEDVLSDIPENINIIYTPFIDNFQNTEILKLRILDFSET